MCEHRQKRLSAAVRLAQRVFRKAAGANVAVHFEDDRRSLGCLR